MVILWSHARRLGISQFRAWENPKFAEDGLSPGYPEPVRHLGVSRRSKPGWRGLSWPLTSARRAGLRYVYQSIHPPWRVYEKPLSLILTMQATSTWYYTLTLAPFYLVLVRPIPYVGSNYRLAGDLDTSCITIPILPSRGCILFLEACFNNLLGATRDWQRICRSGFSW